MNGLIGFVALSLPILIPFGIVVVGLTITWLVVRQVAEKKSKRRAWLIGIIMIILIPTWDMFLGRAYYHSLCATQGGAKIYKQVELPDEYWEEIGGSTFLDDFIARNRDRVTLEIDEEFHKNYQFKSETIKLRPHFLHIKKKLRSVVENQSGEILGTYTTYFYSGGWLVNSTAIGGPGGAYCPREGNKLYGLSFLREIFVPSTNSISTRR